jgi:hypothetical protein
MKLLDRLLFIIAVAVIFFGLGYLYHMHEDVKNDIRHGRPAIKS